VTTTLRLGTFTPSVVLAVADRLGRLAEHGLDDVIEVTVSSSPGQLRSLLSGELDVALTSPDNVLAYRFDSANPLGQLCDARIVSAVDRGLGLALYGRPGRDTSTLRGATVGVDVPTSGFALALYALAESLGVARDEYELVTLGSTPQRLRALLGGECDATMLNAGNELFAEQAGCVAMARASEVCAPYLGTVVAVTDRDHLPAARALGEALQETAVTICDGEVDELTAEEAVRVLGLPHALALRYVDRLKRPDEGLLLTPEVPPDALATLVRLRQRYLPHVEDGVEVLDAALDPASGLVDSSVVG
jgi:ABC-type nitrate/sulfonate/bicarbonate transport system substrate-binding protein